MASIKVCFAVGLFIIALSPTGFSEDIPDGVVYTEIKKTLVNGTKGILTCQFKGTPNAVYWIKGSGTNIDLSFITWAYGSKSGPRYEDGSCDIDENYSLIINEVAFADAGRYICEVSSYKGFLIYNYTDVTITNKGVKTQQSVSFQMGEVGVLPCQVNIRPKMVSWLKGINSTLVTMDLSGDAIEILGPEYNEGLFNITKEYSFVVNDVTIQHEGYFFCEVTDFDTDKLYRDDTLLTVFAKPTDPFPVIQECSIADQSNCIITTDSSVILTCHVNQYYPDINLVFMRGSELIESLTTKTWNNTDGTKNKNVTISADISHDVYKCIASGIPGFDLNDERSSSVRLIQHVQEQSNSPILAVLIVPIVICLTVILLAWLRFRKRRTQFLTQPLSVHRNTKDEKSDGNVDNGESPLTDGIYTEGNRQLKEERYMEDHISYVELWKLVEFIINNHEKYKLDDVMSQLHGRDGEERSQEDKDQKYYYQQLCRWKETCDQIINQRNTLYEKCLQARLDECVEKVEEYRQDMSTEIPLSDFEHSLWQLGEPRKIKEFLGILGMHMKEEVELLSKKKMIQVAVGKLSTWKPSTLHFNRAVILSSMMEMLDYLTTSDNFFQIPAEKKAAFLDDECKRFLRDLTALTTNHYHKIESIIQSSKGRITPNDPNDNNKVLFDIEKMLLDWLENVECSNYDKRRTLELLSPKIFDVTESPVNNHWPSDDELKLIAGYLDSSTMESLCADLNITSLPKDADEKERFEALCQWRISATKKDWPLLYGQLRSAFEMAGVSGLLPPLRNDPIHKAEYVDIAFDLLMTDVLPVAMALSVNVNKLPAYSRPVFKASHLQKGTIGLVAELVESVGHSRLFFCNRLREAGFPMAVTKNILVNHMAYGELFTISNAIKEGECMHGVKDISSDDEKATGENENLLNSSDVKSTEIKNSHDEAKAEEGLSFGHFSKIKKMLQLTDEDLAICSLSSEQPDEFTLFRMWKERAHLVAFNERTAIIQGLLDIGSPDIARSVAEGNFCVSEVNLDFIKCIVKKMDENEVGRFEKAFSLQKEFKKSTHSDEAISAVVHGFLKKRESKAGLGIISEVGLRMISEVGLGIFRKATDARALTDKLVDNGFLVLARELISIHK